MRASDSTCPSDAMSSISVEEENYGRLPDGREARLFTLANDQGITAKVTSFGAILTNLFVPDRDGGIADVVHGFDELSGWIKNEPYFGATIGRFGNRIARGSFRLNGREYALATNNEPAGVPCHLHGGQVGFSHVLWEAEIIEGGVRFSYLSPDGEEGYPGNLRVSISYLLNNDNELIWKAEAQTDEATPINLIHHSYWNLSGNPSTSITDHRLFIDSEHFLPTNPSMIPTGDLQTVAGTPMDFRTEQAIGARIEAPFPALEFGNGYDHCWVLRGENLRLVASVADPKSGRSLQLSTDQAGLQFYTANFLDGSITGKNGINYEPRSALCLETEAFPDSPNQANFPSSILQPGETYNHTMVHKLTWS